ncbi:MAG: M55 family metallopeptidase [Candidatus Aminicenantes bacterium]|nr:M55 family metallopeptidase [Candidatus Aminicenantes bacterium]
MKKMFGAVILIFFVAVLGLSADDLKVFISVDMEGVCGVIHWEEVTRSGKDYDLFRKLMTEETNAAIEGALEAGATKILVRDSHGSGRNILPDLLNEKAELIRDWSGGPLDMMEGIDKSFDAVIFVGYHARANTPDATLDHTMSGSLYDVVLNGQKMPEAGINAFIAGNFGVPVVLVAGDLAICNQAKELFGDVVIAPVKEGIGNAAKMLHPNKARELIKEKTIEALKRVKSFKPFTFTPPYVMEVTYKDEKRANEVSWIPGAKKAGPTKVTFTSNDLMDILKFFSLAM